MGTWIEIRILSVWQLLDNVVPYVGTWIEIQQVGGFQKRFDRRSLRGNVDRNCEVIQPIRDVHGRSLRGNVDRNDCVGTSAAANYVVPYVGTWIEMMAPLVLVKEICCRSLRGNVDRNIEFSRVAERIDAVVPYVGTWIEIDCVGTSAAANYVVPYVGTWIEIVVVWASQNASGGRSLRGNVDRNSLPPIVTVCALGRSLRGNVDRNSLLF